MAAINRVPFNELVDDDGSGTTGTVWNKHQIKTVLLDPIDAAIVPAGMNKDVQYNNAGIFAGQRLWWFGSWEPVTNGDPASPELLFDSNGAVIVGFVPLPY